MVKRNLKWIFGCLCFILISCGSSKTDPDVIELNLVGSWNVQSYNNGFEGETGNIIFSSDGTYSFTGVISVSPNGCWLTGCTSSSGTWGVQESSLVTMTAGGYSNYLTVANWTTTQFTATCDFNTSVFTKATSTTS